ncbi:MAG: methyl-accepting chemotaxis protein [Chloroflexi bacterium]|nr:methyl-accepting chemotaxis protein [Chloroflexota bacterium]MBU1752040.1 methyl-accepting chemotaxis protein [Chloroflexota bacterium]MBU1877675.1 methyl-accepting chemotaxis protein [Chloroflexota bacterium]
MTPLPVPPGSTRRPLAGSRFAQRAGRAYYWLISLPIRAKLTALMVVVSLIPLSILWVLAVVQANDSANGAIHQISLSGMLLSFLALLLSTLAAWALAKWITSPIQRIMVVMQAVRQGDYAPRVQVNRADETGRLAWDLNAMLDDITALMAAQRQNLQLIVDMAQRVQATSEQVSAAAQELSASTEQLNSSAEQVSLTMQQLARGATIQAEEVEQVSHTIAEMAHTTEGIARNASDGAEAVQNVHGVLLSAGEVLRDLGEKSSQISRIVTVVEGIADQTQLLSLNAAIEAARAGEYGRGFAVVADEVRRLSDSSTWAVSEIATLSTQIQKETARLAQRMNQLHAALDTVTNLSAATTEATSQQEKGTDQIARSMNGMAAVAEQNAAATEQVSAAVQEQTASMQEIAASAQELSDVATHMQMLVQELLIHHTAEKE